MLPVLRLGKIVAVLWNGWIDVITGRRAASRACRQRREAFFRRYTGRTLIVHAGLPIDWLEALLKTGGGAGHFRLDARPLPQPRPSPVVWVVQEFLLPLALPLPVLVDVAPDALRVRHLLRYGGLCQPTDILWILEDIRIRGRTHATLHPADTGFRCEHGITPDDNAVQTIEGVSF